MTDDPHDPYWEAQVLLQLERDKEERFERTLGPNLETYRKCKRDVDDLIRNIREGLVSPDGMVVDRAVRELERNAGVLREWFYYRMARVRFERDVFHSAPPIRVGIDLAADGTESETVRAYRCHGNAIPEGGRCPECGTRVPGI